MLFAVECPLFDPFKINRNFKQKMIGVTFIAFFMRNQLQKTPLTLKDRQTMLRGINLKKNIKIG